jgi:hypothetical protein
MKAKLENLWYHYKTIIIVALVVLAAGAYMLSQQLGIPKADLNVAVVCPEYVSDEARAALEEALAAAGQDLNGDGRVVVGLRTYQLEVGADGQDDVAIGSLDADLVSKYSGLFFLDDPAALEKATNGLFRASDAVFVGDWPALGALPDSARYAFVRSDGKNSDAYAQMLDKLKG